MSALAQVSTRPAGLYGDVPAFGACPEYGSLRLPGLRIAEPQGDPISEADLSLIWEAQRYPPGALSGPDGSTVEVLYPGWKGGGAGPDFRDAVVKVDGSERIGDVELHVRASYFLQHGHHLDPAYDRLALHVVYLDDTGGRTPLPCGSQVEIAAFAPWVAARSADIAAWLANPPLWREPCRDAPARLGAAEVAATVRGQGRGRFAARTQAMAQAIAREGAGEAIWQALVEGLGYGGDRDGFRRLAKALPAALLAEVAGDAGNVEGVALDALLFVAGLRDSSGSAVLLPPPLTPPLRGVASRPANRPEQRLAGAAWLFARSRGDFAETARRSVSEASRASELLALWARGAPGLGSGRATELLMNAVLPFVAACYPDLATKSLDLAEALPRLPPYGKTSFLERNLAAPDGRRPIRRALEQQGLLALHADWCSKGGCGRCPLS